MKNISIKLFLFSLLFLTALSANHLKADILQQSITVTGTVTDEAGERLPGVTVLVKGTTFGTITSIDGSVKLIVI